MAWPGPPTLPAVISVERIHTGRDGEWTTEGRSYTATWRAITAEPVIGPIDAMTSVFATLFPLGAPYVSFYEYDYYATLKSISAKPENEPRTKWIITGKYDTQVKPGRRLNNPIEQSPTIEWDFGTYQKRIDNDRDDKAILNSAGEPPNPPYVETRRTLILRYTRSELSYNPITAMDYLDHINSSSFLGAEALTVKLNKWLGKQKHFPAVGTFAGGEYWEVQYEFEWNPEGWDEEILDMGMIDADGNHIKTENKYPVTHPVLLKDGFKKEPTDPPQYITVKRFPLADLNALNVAL